MYQTGRRAGQKRAAVLDLDDIGVRPIAALFATVTVGPHLVLEGRTYGLAVRRAHAVVRNDDYYGFIVDAAGSQCIENDSYFSVGLGYRLGRAGAERSASMARLVHG